VWATATRTQDSRFAEVPESVHAILRFSGDRLANFICSFGAADRARYEVVGTKGSVAVDPAFEYAEGLAYELRVGDSHRRKSFKKSDQFAPELVHFAKAVRANRPPEPSGKEGLIDVAIIEAIHRSLDSGHWQKIGAPQRQHRPSMSQALRRPAVPREPALVQVESGHR
jgi:glucose-fructose oxidoreductase